MLLQISRQRELSDCLNCAASHRLCDRTRYRCDTCSQNVDVCQGYPRPLRWLPGVTARGKDKHKSLSIESSNPKWQPVYHVNHAFKFKPGRREPGSKPAPKRSRHRRARDTGAGSTLCGLRQVAHSPSQQYLDPSELSSGTIIELSPNTERSLADAADFLQDSFETGSDPLVASFIPGVCEETIPLPSLQGESTWGEQESDGNDDNHDDVNDDVDFEYDIDVDDDDDDDDEPALVIDDNLSAPEKSLSLVAESTELLTFYDSELCKFPFTHDFSENPLRCTQGLSRESKHVRHALLAFSLQHVSRLGGDGPSNSSLTNHITTYKYSAAESCTSTSLVASSAARKHLLDTIVILFALDALISAFGPWSARLSNAYRSIESVGGLKIATSSPRARAQLMMFVWWDCSTALVARSDPVFPSSYYDYVLDDHDGATYDIFTVSGVPRDLFKYCRELTEMASEKRQVGKLKHAVFDMSRALELEHRIREYPIGSGGGNSSDEELIECWHDYHNAVSAWKYALLLYIARVFKWDEACGVVRLPEFTSLARRALDSVRCCRPESPMQKQLLFPVFVAGAESLDAYSRDLVSAYCDSWSRNSRYTLFHEALGVLEEIWTLRDLNANDPRAWWGSVIDSRQSADGYGFLFG